MPIDPWRPCAPLQGDHFLLFERRFRYLVQDPSHSLLVRWIPTVLECPVCQAEHGMRLALQESQDLLVQAQCHRGHLWPEPRVDRGWFAAYSRIRGGLGEADDLWLTEAGFGEEPPEPIDYLQQIKEGWGYGAKYVARKAKTRVKAEVRRPVNKAKKKARNEAMRPVAAVLRAAWGWQAGGSEPVKKARSKKTPAPPPTPPASAYRKAYGMEAPKKGPKCLVCEDTGRITAPGVSIPCSECSTGPAPKSQATTADRGTKRTITGPVITRDVHDAIDRAAHSGGARINNGVVIRGKNLGTVQSEVGAAGNVQQTGRAGGDE